jgi:hypothetical protein
VINGTLSGEDFLAAAEAKKTSDGYIFDRRRYFLDDDHLLHLEGKTCALSNEWSIVSLPLIDEIASALPPEVKDDLLQKRLNQLSALHDIRRTTPGSRSLMLGLAVPSVFLLLSTIPESELSLR